MNKFSALGLSLSLGLLTSLPAHAGEGASCHFHGNKPAAESTVLSCAVQYKNQLVKGGKLESSWQAIAQAAKVEQVDGKRAKEWKLTFKNPSATDKTKDTLYLFYSLPGNFIAANHTGQ